MRNQTGQASVVLVLILVVLALAAICALSGNAIMTDPDGNPIIGKPEQFAQATAISRAADLARSATQEYINYRATQNAANGQATATAAAVSVAATSTSIAQQAQATATAVPYQAGLARTEATTSTINMWAVSLLGVVGGLLLAVSAGFAFVAWLRTKSKVAWVGANGPVLILGNTAIDMGKAVGPAVTVSKPGLLLEVDRVKHYLKTGEVKPREEMPLQLTDGGATADHYLEAARVSGHTNAMGAMFRPDNAERGRDKKLDRIEKSQQKRIETRSRMPTIRLLADPEEFRHVEGLFLPEGSLEE